MFSAFFSSFIYNPLYNSLVFLINHAPYADVGIAIILLTCAVKLVLLPLAHTAVRSQIMMNAIKGDLDAIREKYKNDKQKQAQHTMALYKEKNINPFAMILPLLIQIPIIFGLYWVFFRGGLPNINTDLLYGFIPLPESVNMQFIGLIDMGGKSVALALFAGITQYIQAKLAFPKLEARAEQSSFKDDLARSMHLQMRYVLPIIVGVIAYTISAAVALYWTTSNIFAIGQEIFVRRKLLKRAENNHTHHGNI